MNQLSVIFVNYQSGDRLALALQALVPELLQLSFEIVIVNNDRCEDLKSVRAIHPTKIQVIQNPTNLGFGAAVNRGFQRSTGRFVLILNPDVLALKSSIAALLRAMESDEKIGMVLPKLQNPDGTLQYSCRRHYSLATLIMRRGPWKPLFKNHSVVRAHLMKDWKHDTPSEVDWGLGAAMLVRRGAVPVSGPFDERFFLYFEDVDLCIRMRQTGWKILYEPRAVLVHEHRRGSARRGALKAKCQHLSSLMKFLWKHRFQPGGLRRSYCRALTGL